MCVCVCMIDIEVLKERSRKMPPGTFNFVFCKVSSTRIILVANLNDSIAERYLKLHFENYTGKNSVQNVKMLHSSRALVTFVNPNRE